MYDSCFHVDHPSRNYAKHLDSTSNALRYFASARSADARQKVAVRCSPEGSPAEKRIPAKSCVSRLGRTPRDTSHSKFPRGRLPQTLDGAKLQTVRGRYVLKGLAWSTKILPVIVFSSPGTTNCTPDPQAVSLEKSRTSISCQFLSRVQSLEQMAQNLQNLQVPAFQILPSSSFHAQKNLNHSYVKTLGSSHFVAPHSPLPRLL